MRTAVVSLALMVGGVSVGVWTHGPRFEESRRKIQRATDWAAEALLGWMIAATAGLIARERSCVGAGWSSASGAVLAKWALATLAALMVAALAWPSPAGWDLAVAAWAGCGLAVAAYVAQLPPRL